MNLHVQGATTSTSDVGTMSAGMALY